MSSTDRPAFERVRVEIRRMHNALSLLDHMADHETAPNGFRELADIKQSLVRLEVALFENQVAQGRSWSAIGHNLGVTKQSAFKRYRRLLKVQE